MFVQFLKSESYVLTLESGRYQSVGVHIRFHQITLTNHWELFTKKLYRYLSNSSSPFSINKSCQLHTCITYDTTWSDLQIGASHIPSKILVLTRRAHFFDSFPKHFVFSVLAKPGPVRKIRSNS